MTDIVERLRAAPIFATGVFPTWELFLLEEAADEIERLRAALKRIDGINDNPAVEAVLQAALQPPDEAE